MATVINKSGINSDIDKPISKRVSAPAQGLFLITPNDNVILSNVTTGIRVGVAGDIVLETEQGEIVSITNIATGETIPVNAVRVLATGTSATELVGEY